MDSVHHIWCPLFSQEFQDLPDGAETTLTGYLGIFKLKPTLLQTVENILQTLSMLFQLTGRLIDVKALVSGSAVAKNV